MIKNKYTVGKKNDQDKNKKDLLKKKTEDRMKSKKSKQMRKKRLIIRNLSFKVSEEQLKNIFSEFGEVLEVNIPVNEAGRKRGFAFVQFKDSKSQMRAMKAMNFKEICGRPIALDFALDKTSYQVQQKEKTSPSKLSKDSDLNESDSDSDEDEDAKQDEVTHEETSDDPEEGEDSKVTQFLKEFNADNESDAVDSESSDESSDSDNEEKESHFSDDNDERQTKTKQTNKKEQSDDVSEGKTIFIRNVSYKNTEEDLQEVMEEYGETVYCLLCMDPYTDHPKGTAFVKFKERESAEKLIEESEKEPGIMLDGRRLVCTYAVSRKELLKKNFDSAEVKDKRNLRLLKCSLIMHGSKESEGVSQTDMAKRAQLEMIKKKKLKNVNFFVSDKRLAIHNLPKNLTDKDIRILFKKAAGKEAIIKEARVMRDFKKTDSKGIPVSRGFGFVSFTGHEQALKALTELNNNPNIFTTSKRPIVEFSVENKVALLSQERKREKLKLQHKKKLEEKLMKSNEAEESSDPRNESLSFTFKRKQNKSKIRKFPNKNVKKENSVNNPSPEKLEKKRGKKQKNGSKHKKRKGTMNTQEKKFVSNLADVYKKKLQNKLF